MPEDAVRPEEAANVSGGGNNSPGVPSLKFKRGRRLGGVLVVVGTVLLVAGFLMLKVTQTVIVSLDPIITSSAQPYLVPGGIAVVTGAVALVCGVALLVHYRGARQIDSGKGK